jgi:hypothetical protein
VAPVLQLGSDQVPVPADVAGSVDQRVRGYASSSSA